MRICQPPEKVSVRRFRSLSVKPSPLRTVAMRRSILYPSAILKRSWSSLYRSSTASCSDFSDDTLPSSCSILCISVLMSRRCWKAVLVSSKRVRPECVSPSCGRYPTVSDVGSMTLPLSASSRRARILRRVVFPAPFGPQRPTRSRSPMFQVTFSRRTRSPKDLVSSDSWITIMPVTLY